MSTTLVQKKGITNKLLVVGHPFSDYESVIDLLNKNGINLPSPLIKEGIKAKEISNILLKAHGIHDNDAIEQISVNPMWNGLVMDLMMSNLSNPLWAWADSDALPLLNYWKSLDSNLAFILVYNSPENFIENILKKIDSYSIESLKQEFDNWCSYNRELLNFYYRNSEYSLLVNAKQVQANSKKYLQEVGKQIGLDTQKFIVESIVSVEKKANNQKNKQLIYTYLSHEILQDNLDMQQLYMELQSAANLPLDISLEQKVSTIDVMASYYQEQTINKQEFEKKQKKLEAFEKELSSEKAKRKELLDENELQLMQLMNAQEELEKQYLENRVNVEKFIAVTKEKDTLQLSLNAYQNKFQELEKELNSEKAKRKELLDENELQLTQLISVQEEFEKYYLKNIDIKNKTQLPQNKKLYGAGKRIKEQLSYRIGSLMIEKSYSIFGSLALPFTLYTEVLKFRKRKLNQKKLPPIHTYADANDAKSVKRHLSYILGQAMIQSLKSPIGVLKLPFALKQAHKKYKEGKYNV